MIMKNGQCDPHRLSKMSSCGDLAFSVLLCSFLCIIISVRCQIAFPSDDVQNVGTLPSDNRIPIENKELCDENELYYPGDQMVDWVCDCKPSYLYVPDKNKCYPAYERGPCRNDEFLILPENTYTPVCRRNPCRGVRAVTFRGQCRTLGGPCDRDPRRRIGVNETTLAVECLQPPRAQFGLNSRFGEESENVFCYKGCKRYHNMKCPQQLVEAR